ncbi:isocitrate lyase/phosphoenolpyruvate mutase family protein [Luteimonas sp. RD2P54]|uniref:Isocitrate lyase/phosphoenolpyruvate mutase family protein n=1 Tax=Luteimonas endophytica TaxID=3042023 RepID=A0ABT6J7S3_9GAMM|nr:isocitrate lyase/phosphoenolpyruvate mutase family protein [Luteimonas endophytica]MDH5822873.1 isocitrate lyase/phosphoenolpyruvate mutase family protein [Luteimonas endophytica]
MQRPDDATFRDLHRGPSPLLLPNAWDAASARLWQQAGAAALATSSAALAWSCGYADGGALPRDVLLNRLREIVRAVQVPLSVDLEDGYSADPAEVAALAAEVAGAGAAGINLEDGAGEPALLVAKIRAVRALPEAAPLFVNARTDVYLRGLAGGGQAAMTAIERLNDYREAGADGGFVPGLDALDGIAAIVAAVPLPLNLMAGPGLPPLDALRAAGVRRISTGPALFFQGYAAASEAARRFLAGDPRPAPDRGPGYDALNRMFARAEG